MRQDIETIIRNNREAFEAEQLPEGYLADFQGRLTRPKRHLAYSISTLIAVAASIMLVLILQNPNQPYQQQIEPGNSFTTEVAEMQLYYTNQQQQVIAIINKLLESSPPDLQLEIRTQLVQMEIDDIEFQKGLKQEINKEQYLASIVSYNKIRQTSLNNIQQILTRK